MAYELIHVFQRLGTVPANIILVGAWEGGEVKGFLEAGVQMVYLFEAEPSAIKKLTEDYGSNSRVKLFEGAVSSSPGKIKKFHILNHSSSSLFTPNLDLLRKIISDFEVRAEIQVSTITLDASLREHYEQLGKNKLDNFLILDIQGGELEAIKGATELLERVGWIHAEVSTAELYQDQNTLAQLDEYLIEQNFIRASTRIHPELNHGDALYFRPELITKSFLRAMRIEDFHWNLARKKPTWLPSLSDSRFGRLTLKLIYGEL